MGVYEDLMARANKWKQNQNTQAAKPQSGQSGGSTNSVYEDLMARANALNGKQQIQPTEQEMAVKTKEASDTLKGERKQFWSDAAMMGTAGMIGQYSPEITQMGRDAWRRASQSKDKIAQAKTAYDDAKKKQEAAVRTNARRDELIQSLNNVGDMSLGPDYYLEQRKAALKELHEIDEQLGNAEHAYDASERIEKTVGGALKGYGGNITNAAGTAMDWLHENWDNEMYEGWEDNPYADYSSLPKGGKPLVTQEDVAPLKYGADKLQGTADKLTQESMREIGIAKADLSALGQAGVDLSVNLVQMGADAAGRAIGLGMLPFFTRAAGGAAQEARQAGANVNQQLEYGVTKGLIEVGTEKLFDGVAGIFGKGAADDVVESVVRKLAKTDNGRTVLRAFAGAAGEGTEEVISDLLDPFAKLIYNDQAVKEAWENRKDLASDMLYDYLIGFAMGGLGAGGSIITGQDAAKNEALWNKDNAALDIDQQNAPNAQHTQKDTESRRAVNEALTSGRINNTTARQIAETPAFAKAFEGITGIKLTGTMYDKVTTIQRAARDRAQVMGQAAQVVAESTIALSEQSAQEAALEEAYQRTQNERRAQREAQERAAHEEAKARTRYGSYIRDTLRYGATVQDAKEIINNPVAKAAWEFATGKTLPDSNNKAVEMILNARENAITPAMQEIDSYVEQRAANNRTNRPLDDLDFILGLATQEEVKASKAAREQQEANNAAGSGNAFFDAVMDTVTGQPVQSAMQSEKNTAPAETADAGETALRKAPREAVTEAVATSEAKNIRNLVPASIGQIKKFVQDALHDATRFHYIKISDVSPELTAALAMEGIDVSGYSHVLRDNDIRHIDKRHGSKSNAKHKVSEYDIMNAQNIIDNYDTLYRGYDTKDGNPTIAYEKKLGDKYYYVEEVLSAGGMSSKQMIITGSDSRPSFLKKFKKIASSEPHTDVAAETRTTGFEESLPGKHVPDGGSVTDTISIPTSGQNVNRENAPSSRASGYANLAEQYGTIPAGENPFRESAMPQSTTGEDRVSRTARTIYEAEATPDTRLGDIRQAVVDGKLSYVPVSNSTLEAEARQSIEYKGWNESLRDWTADVRSGKVNPKLIAMGEALINNAGNSSMSGADYISLVSDFNQLVSGTAQALQAVRIFKTLTPEAKLFALQRSAQSIADKLNEETKKQYNIEISDDLADRFLAQTTDEGRNAVIEEIQQSIADQIPSTWQERWDALRYTNMLGNFKTQIRNVGGNTVMLATRFAKDRVAATLETAASILTGGKFERTKSLIVNPKLMKEAKADFANVVDIAKGEGKYQSVRAQMDKGIQDKRRIFKSGFMEAYRKATNWAMDKGDKVFLGAIYSDAMAGWLQAHGINSLSEATEQQLDAARTYAIKEAQEATLRDDNSLSRLVSGFDRSWGQYGKAGKAAQKLTQGIVPFRKTPANVAVRAVEYSPLGLAGSIWKAARAKKTGTSGAEVINSFAKGATGTALAAAGYFLARAGLARGVDDDEDEAALNKLNGRLDWSIRIGDMDISLSQLAPMAIPFFMGVRFQELTEDGFTPRDLGNIFFATISDPMLEMSMLQGVNDALEGLSRNSNTPGAAIDFAINALLGYYTQGLTNGLLSQLEQALTENRQTIYTDSDDPYLSSNLQYKLGQFTSKFPTHLIPGGHGYHQQDYLDAFGNTQSNGSGVERVFNAFINPVYTSKIRENNVTSELGRLMEDNKNVDNFPGANPERPGRSTTVNGEKLTAGEYQQYAKAAGNISQDMLQDFMRSGEYRKLGDEDRAQVVSDIYSYAREQAAKQILNTRGTRDEDITTTWKWGKADNAMNAGLSFGQYEAVKNGRETNTDNSYGIAVNKLDGLSDGDKLKALETFLPADKNGKRSATVRRYEAAMEAGLYFDTWTKVVDAMDKMGNPTSKAQITAVMERVFPGYGDALYAIWNSPDTEMYIEGSPEPKTKEQKQADFLSLLDEVFGTGA